MDDVKKYLSTAKAAQYLCITVTQMRQYARDGKIPYSRPGGKMMLFDIADLEAFFNASKRVSNGSMVV